MFAPILLFISIVSGSPTACDALLQNGASQVLSAHLQKIAEQWVSRVRSLPSRRALTKQRQNWATENFTNPREHSDQAYAYLVHAVMPNSYHEHTSFATMRVALAKAKAEGREAAWIVDLISEPHRISEKKMISTSVITPESSRTAGYEGFILSAPQENIYAATPYDMGTIHAFEPISSLYAANRAALNYFAEYGLPPPQEIIQRTGNQRYNEVLVLGEEPGGNQVSIVGVFHIVEDGSWPDDLEWKRIADSLGVPYVRINRSPRGE